MSDINWNGIKDFLLSKTGVCYYNSSRTQLITKCFNCERLYSKNKGHLYLKLDDKFPVFHCFKCETSGTVKTLISEYNGSPIEFVPVDLKLKSPSRRKFSTRKKVHVITPELDNDKYRLKYDYIKNRLNVDLNTQPIPRIVFSIKEFIEKNNIELTDWCVNDLDKYEDKFIGFITNNNNKIILRNCDSNDEFRYVKLSITQNPDYYGIINNVHDDVNSVVMCEGVFDVLLSSTHEDVSFKLKNKNICGWAAVLGNNYANAVDMVLNDCGLPRANIIILSDSNIRESRYGFLKRNPRVASIEVYWNRFGSDFGENPISLIKSNRLRRRRL